jgi:hypothetical protein
MTLSIVIGLPCSGKTYLSRQLGAKTYDDFIFNFYSGELIRDLKSGIDVCINDPRLCNYEIFKRYMDIFENFCTKTAIILYLFENNPEQCKKNMNEKNVSKFIEFYTKLYDLKNYHSYKHIIVPVFSQ